MKLLHWLSIILATTTLTGALAHGQNVYPPVGDKHWKAPVASFAALPATGNSLGDARIETTAFGIYVWNGTTWVSTGGGGGGSWLLTGNVGTGGTGKLGTTDTQPFDIITDGVTRLTYGSDGQASSIQNVVPVSSTNYMNTRYQVNLNPAASTTGMNFIMDDVSVGYDGGNTGFNFAGNITGRSTGISHSGIGTVDFASSDGRTMLFAGVPGTTTLAKNSDTNANVGSGYTVTSYEGVTSYLTSTGGIFGNADAFQFGMSLNDTTANYFDGLQGNMTVGGTSIVSGSIIGVNTSTTLQDSATANQVIGSSAYASALNTSTTAGVTGGQVNVQMGDTANVTNQSYGHSVGVDMRDSSVSNGADGVFVNMQVRNSAQAGNLSAGHFGVSAADSATAMSVNGLNLQVQTSGASVVTNNVSGSTPTISMSGTSSAAGISGETISVQLHDNAVATNAQPFSVDFQVNDSATVTNGFTLANFNASSNTVLSGVTGLNLSISNVQLADALNKVALNTNGGKIQTDFSFTIPPADTFFQGIYHGNNPTVASGSPISSLGFFQNVGGTIIFDDDWTPDFTGLRIGLAAVAAVPAIQGAVGKTMDSYEGFLAGMNNAGGAGTLDQAFMYRALGVLPSGGSLAVNNMVAFGASSPLCAAAGSCWGVKIEDTAATNAFARNVVVGANTASNASVGLELNATDRALLISRMTTAQRTALTPLDGMQVYDTDLSKFYCYEASAWKACDTAAGAVTAVTASAPLASSGGATPDISLTGVVPIANGGTNSSTALNDDRIMVSSGGAIVEAAALADGELLIGSTGAAPVAAAITAGTGISVTNGPGSITIAASGAASANLSTKTANYTLTGSDDVILVDSASALTMTLPDAATAGSGKRYDIKNINTGVATIATTSSQTIDGELNQYLYNQYDSITVISDGSNWYVL